MRNIIRLGDATNHGGKVVSCNIDNFVVNGIPVASVDDLCSCPLPGHSGSRIVSGSERHTVNGKKLAFEGDETSCGAKLIASRGNFSTS